MQQLELGQLCFAGNTQEFEVPLFACSLLRGIRWRIGIVYWNVTQKPFEQYGQYEAVDLCAIRWRPYTEEGGPNLWLDFKRFDLQVSWYKNFGRSMTCSQKLTVHQWVRWHDVFMAELDRVDKEWSDGRSRNYLA